MKLNKIFANAFLALAAVAGFTACSSDDYDMVGMPEGAQVFFSNEANTSMLLEENQNSVEVEVNRIKTDGELTVNVSATDESGIFTAAKTVTFADGQGTAKLPISFDFSKLESDKDYPVTLTLEGETCAYGDNTMTVNIKFAPWTQWKSIVDGYCTYNYSQYFSGPDPEQKVLYRESMLEPTKAEIKLTGWGGYGDELILTWDKKLNLIKVAPHETYTNQTYGAVYVADTYTYITEILGKEADLNTYRSYFDEEKGCFMLNLTYFVSAGYFGMGYETLQLPGYEQSDYTINIADNGTFGNKKTFGQVLNMTLGADIVNVKYAVIPGAITDANEIEAKAQEIFEGTITSTEVKESGYKVVTFDEEGTYTMIALGYDANGKWQSTQSITFNVSLAPENTWTAIFNGDYKYSLFFTDENDNPISDPCTLYQCNEDENLYKIAPWGNGEDTEFRFTMDEEGNITVLSMPIGYEHQQYGEVYVGDAPTLFPGKAADYPSYYADGVFHFSVVYYVEAGVFGLGYETFTLTSNAAKALAKAQAKAKAKAKKAKKLQPKTAAPRVKFNKNVGKLTLKTLK